MVGKRTAVSAAGAVEHHRMHDELKALHTQVHKQVNKRAKEQDKAADGAGPVQSLEAELALIRETIAHNIRELGALICDGNERRMARAADELSAAVDGMETATDGILKSVEIVDESAKALTATLRDDYKRGLAADIQDQVVKIYEACNFQDLAGQRIAKAISTLTTIEEQVAAALARCHGVSPAQSNAPAKVAAERAPLNGPKLDGDHGHASQHDIDKLFG